MPKKPNMKDFPTEVGGFEFMNAMDKWEKEMENTMATKDKIIEATANGQQRLLNEVEKLKSVKEVELNNEDEYHKQWDNWQEAITIILGSTPAGDYADQIMKLISSFTIQRKVKL